eukprot:4729215-Pyramimonas_sp.AAC.1
MRPKRRSAHHAGCLIGSTFLAAYQPRARVPPIRRLSQSPHVGPGKRPWTQQLSIVRSSSS